MRSHVDLDAVVELTRALVRIDTQNPPGNERAAADVARRALEPFGATFVEVEPQPGRLSLVATVPGSDDDRDAGRPRPVLVVNGHLDVVPVTAEDWSHDPFGAEVAGGRIYGRGTADMKGGVACAVQALAALWRAGRPPAADLVFHLVADEERGGRLGTAVLVERGLVRGDACLVPEPTALAACIAERGLLVADITTHGRPAHGSQPRQGVSAVEKAAKVVLALHAADLGDPPHPLLGSPTCNVGVIAGGSGHNTVAEHCRIVVDRRLLPGMTEVWAEADLRRRVDAIGDPDLAYDVQVTTFGEASELDPSHPFLADLQRSAEATLGHPLPVIGMAFSTDARFVRNQAGVPAVVCGPGDVGQAHAADEWVAIDQLAQATALFAELFASFAPASWASSPASSSGR